MRQFSGTCAFQMVAPDLWAGPAGSARRFRSHITHTFGKGENLPKKRWVLGASLLALVAAISITAVAIGQSSAQPADKAFAAGSTTGKFAPGDKVPVLTGIMKTSKPTDVILQVSMECSIITDNVITGG